MAFFGKAAIHPAPAAPTSKEAEMLELLRRQQEQMAQLMARGGQPATTYITIPGTTTSVPASVPASDASLYAAVKQQERAAEVSSQGGEVTGSGGRSVKELLAPGARQTFFTRSTDKPEANLHKDDWRRLQAEVPAGYDEEKYLAKHPDVAEAVRKKVMPSGLYHYVKYGKGEGRALAGWLGLAGFARRPKRRPGYLSGVAAPWRQRG